MLLQGCSMSVLVVWALFKAQDEASSCSLSRGLCVLPMVKERSLSLLTPQAYGAQVDIGCRGQPAA